MADVVTIRQAVERLKTDGLPLSEYSLRLLVKAWSYSGSVCRCKDADIYPKSWTTSSVLTAATMRRHGGGAPGIRRVDL